MKPKEYWIWAVGEQEGLEIDLSVPGEDRWVDTTVQTVDPGNNSVAKKKAFIHVIEKSAYDKAIEALRYAHDVIGDSVTHPDYEDPWNRVGIVLKELGE